MVFDFGSQSAPHLDMILSEQLERYGLVAEIVHSQDYTENEYGEIGDAEAVYPDEFDPAQPTQAVITACLLSKPVEGLIINPDFISYADKVETQYTITLKERLRLEDRIKVTWPDGKWLTLRIVQVNGYHPGSTVCFSGVGLVTREPWEESHRQMVELGKEKEYGDI